VAVKEITTTGWICCPIPDQQAGDAEHLPGCGRGARRAAGGALSTLHARHGGFTGRASELTRLVEAVLRHAATGG